MVYPFVRNIGGAMNSVIEEQGTMVENLVEYDIPKDTPYLVFNSSSFCSFLQLASQFGWKSGRDLTSKSVSITVDDDGKNIICRATDFDSYLEVRIPQKSENPIMGTVVYPTATLSKIIPLCGKKDIVMKEDGILIRGQWVAIEPLVLNVSLFINKDAVDMKGDINIPNLTNLVPIISSAIVPRDKDIQIFKTCIQATCLWSVLRIPYESPLSFLLNAKEINLIKSFSKCDIGLTISDIPRLVFRTNGSELRLLYRQVNEDNRTIFTPEWNISFDFEALSDIITLSDNVPASSGILRFSYDKDKNSLVIVLVSKLEDTVYKIPSTSYGDVRGLKSSTIQTKTIKPFLKALATDKLSISWDDNLFYLSNGQITVSTRWEI